jgi:hypothetical protein
MTDYSFQILDAAVTLHMYVTGAGDYLPEDMAILRNKLAARLQKWDASLRGSVAFDGAARLTCEIAVAEYDAHERRLKTI